MKSLIIVESPAKARTIEKFLGRRYMVRASKGHVRDLPKSQFGVDVEHGFTPKYITIRGKGEVVKELRELAKKAPEVLLATDPDREGEAISWHLANLLGLKEDAPVRIVFHEVTKEALQKAVKAPRAIDQRLVDAQQARRVLDRLVGYKLSPLLWRKIRRGLSAGRVQSVAVWLIVERENAVLAFVPEEYWTLDAEVQTLASPPESFLARYRVKGEQDRLPNREATLAILADLDGGRTARVDAVKRRERKRQPSPPFTTSTLQQDASRRLGFSVRRTMALAQQLYEGQDVVEEGRVGLVTYIRTDSTRIADSAREEAAAHIRAVYGEAYAHPEARKAKEGPNVQGAHEAIRPTSLTRTPERLRASLSPDLYKLYRLIYERFLASQMSPAVSDVVSVDLEAQGHHLHATGSVVKFKGFTILYSEEEEESKDGAAGRKKEGEPLPALQEGEEVTISQLLPEQHFTQPPPRFTEAMLVKTLEELGIGRPSTYAPIIDTIQRRGYVEKRDRRFLPTELGHLVVDLLRERFHEVVDPAFTADMEGRLDRIEEGQVPWQEVVADFYSPFATELAAAEKEIGGLEIPDEVTDIPCDKCGRPMVVKYGRFGKFLACPGFPECKSTRPFVEEVGVSCPRCSGTLVERRTRKGRRFYGCNRYPECDFVTWDRPVNRECPLCQHFLVEKRSRKEGVRFGCSNSECSYEEEGEREEETV